MWQHTQLTGTNSRTLDRIDPLLGSIPSFLWDEGDGRTASLLTCAYGEPDSGPFRRARRDQIRHGFTRVGNSYRCQLIYRQWAVVSG